MNELNKISEKEIEEKVKFLSSAKSNHTPHMYIDITGDLVQGTLLARIMYWFSVDKNKKLKVRIFRDGYFWIAKQRRDWWEEIRITERQYDKAIGELNKKGFVELAKYKFNSMPTIHIRPNYDNINSETQKWESELRKQIIAEYESELSDSENGSNTKCNSQRNENDTKCNSGVTQEGNLLTLITNTDYFESKGERNARAHEGDSEQSESRTNTQEWYTLKDQLIKAMRELGYKQGSKTTKAALSTFGYFILLRKKQAGLPYPKMTNNEMTAVAKCFLKAKGLNNRALIEKYFEDGCGADDGWDILEFMKKHAQSQ